MPSRTQLTTVETVYEEGSWLFTVSDRYDRPDEVLLVPCADSGRADDDSSGATDDGDAETERGVEAWVNRCTHEAQRLDRGFGAAMRDGQIICPKHGSMFDACSGYCDNGEAADTTLVSVAVAVEDGDVYLTDDGYGFRHEGSIEDGDRANGDGGDGGTGDGGDDGTNESDRGDGGTGDEGDDDDDVPSSTSHIGF